MKIGSIIDNIGSIIDKIRSTIDKIGSKLDKISFIMDKSVLLMLFRNETGQLGLGNTKDKYTPTLVNDITGYHIVKVGYWLF